jgi:uncharacterized protein (TIGR02246 family)
MTNDPEGAARGLLIELEDRLATHDLEQMADLFTDDVVLIGDAVENFYRKSTVAYLGTMADMKATVRWKWDRVAVVLSEPGLLSFAATGTMAFDEESGQPIGDSEPFRVTCLAVEQGDRWRLRHFHGSAPRAD